MEDPSLKHLILKEQYRPSHRDVFQFFELQKYLKFVSQFKKKKKNDIYATKKSIL